MVANTPNFGLPYPDDYQQPADSPNALEDLATAVDSALHTYRADAAATFAAITPATTFVGDMQLSAYRFTIPSIGPGVEHTLGPFGINAGTYAVVGTQHPSTYLYAVYNDLGNGTAVIKVRNATTATTHTDVKIHAIFVNPPGSQP